MPDRALDPRAKEVRCAIYMRLSREDDKGTESASIETQRKLLRRFALDSGFCICCEYVDDGISGTTFDRPDFRRMLSDIEAGKIDVVLTKDLSRLGRNSGRVNTLVDEFFPAHRVRYISVGEGVDTASHSVTNNIVTPVQNFANELYAADISNKIRSSLDIKMREGEFIGAFAPYGYRKDPDNKNRLLIDSESSQVVRQIFCLAAEGHSPAQIARRLNDEGVPTPSRYRVLTGLCPEGGSPFASEWSATAVGKILRRQVYLGHTVQGKTRKPSFKSPKTQSRPREDWIVVENTHEPIIDSQLWDLVRRRAQFRSRKRETGFVNIFSGLARCADCGRGMSTVSTRKKGARANLCCGGYKQGGRTSCTCHTIDYDLLCESVLRALREALCLTPEEKAALLDRMLKEALPRRLSEAEELKRRLELTGRKLEQLFEDKYSGRIERPQFNSLLEKFNREKTGYEERLRALKSAGTDEGASNTPEEMKERFRGIIEECCEPKALSSDMLFRLIEGIDVHQGEYAGGVKRQRIVVHFKFRCKPSVLTVLK